MVRYNGRYALDPAAPARQGELSVPTSARLVGAAGESGCALWRRLSGSEAIMSNKGDSIFYSAHLRIERAEEHLKDLETRIDKFFGKKPYATVTEPDPDGLHEIHKIKFTERFPFRWRILATEVVEHARASLDHATFASHLASGGHPDARNVAFPFGRTAADLDNSIKGRSKDLPTEIQARVRNFNAYESGNGPLYYLNELCNISKHAMISFAAGAILDMEIEGPGLLTAQPQFIKEPRWDRAKNEIEYARTKRGVDFEHKGKVTLFVAIAHKEAVSPIPMVNVLDAMLAQARGVVTELEAECSRLGWIKK
jgi:hypothetical protein